MSARGGASAWSELPEDVATKIFGCLEVDGSPEDSRLACRSWRGFSTACVKILEPRCIFPGLAGWRGLTTLNLFICDRSSFESGFARSGFPNLRTIVFDDSHATDADIAHLRPLTGLTDLDLSWSEVTVVGLRHLSHLTALLSLNLSQNLFGEPEMSAVAGVRSLTRLDLQDCEELTDDAVLQLRPLTGLTSLKLSSCEVTDAGVEVVRSMPLLRELTLIMMGDITDRGILDVAGLTNLTDLSLAHTHGMTPVGLMALCSQLTGLTSLNIAHCGCTDMRPPPLRRNPILDEHIAWFAVYQTCLTFLNVSSIGHCIIDYDGEYVDDGEYTITDAGVQQLREAMPGCRIMWV